MGENISEKLGFAAVVGLEELEDSGTGWDGREEGRRDHTSTPDSIDLPRVGHCLEKSASLCIFLS